MLQAPVIGISRHRLSVDGEGVTTLVAFHDCPLRCRYCLNAQCLRPDGIQREVTTDELAEELAVDNLYFLATGGGVTFGGGEPCLRSAFIVELISLIDSRWHINIETSLNVDRRHLERLLPLVHQWIVDIKDINPNIYQQYTGQNNAKVIDNLVWLLSHEGMADRLTVRLPHIPNHNTDADVKASRSQLEKMGVRHFDEFTYYIIEKGEKLTQ